MKYTFRIFPGSLPWEKKKNAEWGLVFYFHLLKINSLAILKAFIGLLFREKKTSFRILIY